MKKILMVATAAALSLSLGVSMPAHAQKKDKKGKKEEEQAASLKVSEPYRKVAGEADKAIAAKDWATAAAKIAEAEAMAASDDEKYYAADLLLRLSIGNGDKAAQIRAIDGLLVSPRTPPERARILEGHKVYTQALAVYDKRDYDAAVPLLLKARELGRTEVDLPVMLANSYANQNKVPEAVAELERAIDQTKAAGQKAPESWYKFAITRVNTLGDPTLTSGWLVRYLNVYPTVTNWRWGLVVYRDAVKRAQNFDNKARIDVFRLMRATGALADQQDYFDYAKAAIELGLPFEASAVIKEGKAGGQIPDDAVAFREVIRAADAGVKAEAPIDTLVKEAQGAKDGKSAASTGDVLLGMGQYARAVEMYDLALQKGNVATDAVNMHRGMALMLSGNKADARAAFAMVTSKPLSDIALYWTAWIDLPQPLAP